jgi:hypothetical protein
MLDFASNFLEAALCKTFGYSPASFDGVRLRGSLVSRLVRDGDDSARPHPFPHFFERSNLVVPDWKELISSTLSTARPSEGNRGSGGDDQLDAITRLHVQ